MPGADLDPLSQKIGKIEADIIWLKGEVKALDKRVGNSNTGKVYKTINFVLLFGVFIWLGVLTNLIVRG